MYRRYETDTRVTAESTAAESRIHHARVSPCDGSIFILRPKSGQFIRVLKNAHFDVSIKDKDDFRGNVSIFTFYNFYRELWWAPYLIFKSC